MTDQDEVEKLRRELHRLRVAAEHIVNLLQTTENRQDRRTENYNHRHPVVRDSDGTEILIGDRVRFLTRGLFSSRTGIVYKISDSGERVTSRDDRNRPISRAPQNLKVL